MQLASGRVLCLSLALRSLLAFVCFFWRRSFAWQGARSCHSQGGSIFRSWRTCFRFSGALFCSRNFRRFAAAFALAAWACLTMFQLLIEWLMECLTCFWGVGFFHRLLRFDFQGLHPQPPCDQILVFLNCSGFAVELSDLTGECVRWAFNLQVPRCKLKAGRYF